jgi:hypothetical protein
MRGVDSNPARFQLGKTCVYRDPGPLNAQPYSLARPRLSPAPTRLRGQETCHLQCDTASNFPEAISSMTGTTLASRTNLFLIPLLDAPPPPPRTSSLSDKNAEE